MARVKMGRHADQHPAYRDGGPDNSGGGKGSKTPWASGNDAAYTKPFLIDDAELLPRDDSGGPEWQPYTQQWGDGGYVVGEKEHLFGKGGEEDEFVNDEVSSEGRSRSAKKAEGEGDWSPESPSKSKKLARE